MTATTGRTTSPDGRGPLLWLRKYGVLASALFLLGTSKWGSYLPDTKPPYISDIVIALIVGHRILYGRRSEEMSVRHGTLLPLAVTALLFWSILELVRGPLSLTSLRDFAPYFYAAAAFVVAVPSNAVRRTINKAIDATILFHAAWCTMGLAAPSLPAHLPNFAGQIHVFQPRDDFDGAVCGVFAAFALHRALSRRAVAYNVGLFAWNAALVLYLKERAGLLAFVFCLIFVGLLSTQRLRARHKYRAQALVPLLTIALPVLYLAASTTPTYQRLIADVHPYVPFVHSSPKYTNSTGTEHAREKAWGRIVSWVGESDTREVIGIGFGPNFMHESGADVLLFGGPLSDARSPHNYFVGTWARLGIVGAVIVSAIVLLGLWLAVLLRRGADDLTDLDVIAMLVAIAMPVAAAVGVILESPFGAVPYFWALGHLSVRCSGLGLADRATVSRRPAIRH